MKQAKRWLSMDAIGPGALAEITNVRNVATTANEKIESSEIDPKNLPKKKKIDIQIRR